MQNLDTVHFSSNIPRPFSILSLATNQAGSLSVGPNNADASKTSGGENAVAVNRRTSGRENVIAVKFDIKNEEEGKPKEGVNPAVENKEAEAPKGDAKVGSEVQLKVNAKVDSEVQPITVVTALVFYRPATAIGTLASLVTVSVCCQPAPVCDARLCSPGPNFHHVQVAQSP